MLTTQVSFGLARLAALARQQDWHAAEAEGLTPTQGDILRMLAGRPEGLRLAAVAMFLQVSQPTASEAVAALARKGLVDKRRSPADQRALLMRATRAGRALAARLPAGFTTVVDAVSRSDQAALLAILVRTIDTLQRSGAIARQRMCVTCHHFAANIRPGEPKPHHCRFIDAPLGEDALRIDCADHVAR